MLGNIIEPWKHVRDNRQTMSIIKNLENAVAHNLVGIKMVDMISSDFSHKY